ncbi:SDR family NAD(P)-dependent oxidoreductase [Bradyrhizobium ontarionense]|uniref:SDR family NAD(P)-dependent oxidoreductase n=2 Tax=Bradyrhizobium ontarionense TaxID=2898149 RepID=A0ABY3RN67_9BRAD|nr:oxidoreductase [Bradyrhizobium sp. A19]UFZ08213.1 SDR family NAD(P)-dependent oxidoreductase [Bradyrhizobium sp. A19]
MANAKQVALVTGASSGMGKVIAERLIKDGMTVIVAARRLEQMNGLKDQGAYPIELDVSDEASRLAAVTAVTESFGGVDLLINNAGFGLYGSVEDVPLADARYQFEVNVFGAAALIQLLVPYMRQKRAGKIINITSMGGKIYTPLGAWYHASKHALEGLSDSLRLELQQFGIDVVVVEPGIIQTNFGNVVEGPMMKFSGKTAYGPLAAKVAKATANSYREGGGSSPQVIADVVSKAVAARKPKTRYSAGRYAKLMMGIRKWLGDRAFDRLVMATVR